MSLIDKTLITVVTSHTVKPWWEICIFCNQPFSTDTFEKTCNRCKHFEKYKDIFASRVMIKFILYSSLATILSSTVCPYLYKYTQNPYHFAVILSILNAIIGISLWRAVKKLGK
jgi:hypothetical protein